MIPLFISASYIGVVPLALLLPACLRPRKNQPVVIIAVVLLVVTFTLGLGNHGPLFWLATHVIPGLGMFRCPGRIFFYTTFPVALLVGLFVSEGRAAARKGIVFALSAGLLAAVTAGAFFLPWFEDRMVDRVWLPVIVLSLFVPVTALWARKIISDKLWKAAVLLLVCGDLFVIWQDHIAVAKMEEMVVKEPTVDHFANLARTEEFRVYAPDSLVNQTYAAKYGIEMITGYHPGVYGRYLDIYRSIWEKDDSESLMLKIHPPRDIARPVILDLMNVVYTVDDPAKPEPKDESTEKHTGKQVQIVRRDSALPRVCLVPKADVPPQGVPVLDALGNLNPREGCLVEGRPFTGGDAFRSLPFERQSPSDVTARFTSEKGGVVVISQAWHPDWRATDHGRPVEVRRVNYDFVGVCVGPGDHEIRVWYRPWDFYLGCWIAAAAWAALASAGVWAVRKRRLLANGA